MMARDLQLRLIVTHLAVTLVGMLLVGVVVAALLHNQASKVHEGDLQHQANALAGQLTATLAKNPTRATLQRTIRRDRELLGKRIILLDPYGSIRYDSARWTPYSSGSWPFGTQGTSRVGQATQLRAGDHLGFQEPLYVHGHLAGAVALLLTASDTQVAWGLIVPAFLLVLALLLLVWAAIGMHFARTLSKPLRQVSEALSAVGGGRYDRPIPEQGWSEARELARRYNEMVAEVARSHQTLRDFMANAAHELKTPVALLAGYSRALEDGTARRGGAVEDAVATIRLESENLARIVEQLFALASLDADAEALTLSACAPDRLAEQVAGRLRLRALGEGKELGTEITGDIHTSFWDVDRVQSAVMNLVENALDYTARGDSITVRVSAAEPLVIFEVQDTGRGIAPDDLPHLFDRFYRGRQSVRSDGHAGLGLALVDEVARRHGGTVSVTSSQGAGTTFTLCLPRGDAYADREAAREAVPA